MRIEFEQMRYFVLAIIALWLAGTGDNNASLDGVLHKVDSNGDAARRANIRQQMQLRGLQQRIGNNNSFRRAEQSAERARRAARRARRRTRDR